MNSCEPFRAQLLPYLYDLLDSEEQQAFRAHLDTCSSCQTALERAQSQRKILAVAAKAEFPNVQFQPPVLVPVRTEGKTSPAQLQRKPRPALRWAIAAGILVLVGLGGASAWWEVRDAQLNSLARLQEERYAALRAEQANLAAEQEAAIARATKETENAQQEVAKVAEQYQGKLAALQKTISDRELNVLVSGPERIQPGTNNEFQIRTLNKVNRPIGASLIARVRDETNQVVFEKDATSSGHYKLSLPADLPVKPNSKLSLEIVARREGNDEAQVREQLSLVAPVYLTHLYTDKPMYRPGETVRFRSLTLERFSLKPPEEMFQLVYTITNPNGEEVFHLDGIPYLVNANGTAPILGPDKQPLRGIGAGEFKIDPAARGGEYTLTVREQQSRFPPQERKFIVNQYENPRLNKELDFTRKSYGPADEVTASCKVARAEGGTPVARRPVIANVYIDGKSYGADGREGNKPIALQTDDKGAVSVRFKLPAAIERGQGSLSVQFSDGANVETLVRPIPIALKKLLIEFLPEGGDLVAGAPNRVYFQARTMLGKPAEITGRIVDRYGKTLVDKIQTLNDDKEPGANQGMGVFAFTPRVGMKYELKIDSPSGIEGKYELPKVEKDGVVLSIANPASKSKEAIQAVIYSAEKDRQLLVGAYCRGRLMDHQTVIAKKGEATKVELKPGSPAGGVYRVTVFEERVGDANRRQLVPRAERLIYHSAGEQLILNVKPDHKQYTPGEKVKLSLKAQSEKEKETSAVLLVSVVDKSVITMADEKTARAMPTHFFLTTEVRRPEDLEYADFLLGTHPKASQALDLLLGTQGWRRFAEQNPGEFRQKFGDDAGRLLTMMGQTSENAVSLAQLEMDRFQQDYTSQLAVLQEKWSQANQNLQAAQNGEALGPQFMAFQTALSDAEHQRTTSKSQLAEHRDSGKTASRSLLAVFGLCVTVLCVIRLIRGVNLRPFRAFAYALGGVAGLIFVFVVTDIGSLGSNAPHAGGQMAMRVPAKSRVPADAGAKVFVDDDLRAVEAAPQAPKPMDKQEPAFLGLNEPDPGFAKPARVGAGGNNRTGQNLFGGARRGMGEPVAAQPVPQAAEGQLLENEAVKGNAVKVFDGNRDKKKEVERQNVRGLIPPQGAERGRGGRGGAVADDRVAPMVRPRQAILAPEQLEGARRAIGEREKIAAQAGPRAGGGAKGAAPGMGDRMAKIRQEAGPQGARRDVLGDDWADDKHGLDRIVPIPEKKKPAFAAKQLQRARIDPFNPVPPLGALQEAKDEKALQTPAFQPLILREYAHHQTPGNRAEERSDFVDTVFWHPAFVLADGKGEVSFDLCDSVTTYQVIVFGHTLDGRIGAATSTIESKLPFTLEPKLPIEVTANDKIDIPISIANNTDDPRQVNVKLVTSNLNIDGKNAEQLTISPNSRVRRLFRLQPSITEGQASLRLEGRSDPFNDTVTRTFTVVPDGFPVVGSKSDLLEKVAQHEIVLPETWVPGTLKCQVSVYPSTLADLQKGLDSLLREPNGCFEQTSSSNYPNALILNYLRESDQANPELQRRARELLARGYTKLVSFECMEPGKNRREGYEWFGGTAPAHEALTAYGLLEFRDMARVFDVDQKMVDRTRDYLMSRRDGKGGFARNPRSLDHFGHAPDAITNAYIVWSLTEGGKEDDVSRELAALAAQAKTSKDPYFLSLVALGLINRDQAEAGTTILKSVAASQKDDGHLDAAQTSITGSGGRDLQIETTALAVLGWLKANRPADFNMPIQKAIKWIGQQRGGYGGFGSSQSTILALKALIAFTQANKQTSEAGIVNLLVGDKVVHRLKFGAGVQEALVINVPEPEKQLKPGKNDLRVEITGKNHFPYTLSWSYRTLKPVSTDNLPVRLSTRLDRDRAAEGETVHLSVTVENTNDKGQGMAVAIVGLPAGLTLPEDMKQLKDHARLRNDGKERGLISAWETRGRELILYWRDLAPNQKIEVPVDLICRVPGEYRGPASRGYLYYNADLKHWVDPLAIKIAPKDE